MLSKKRFNNLAIFLLLLLYFSLTQLGATPIRKLTAQDHFQIIWLAFGETTKYPNVKQIFIALQEPLTAKVQEKMATRFTLIDAAEANKRVHSKAGFTYFWMSNIKQEGKKVFIDFIYTSGNNKYGGDSISRLEFRKIRNKWNMKVTGGGAGCWSSAE